MMSDGLARIAAGSQLLFRESPVDVGGGDIGLRVLGVGAHRRFARLERLPVRRLAEFAARWRDLDQRASPRAFGAVERAVRARGLQAVGIGAPRELELGERQ